MGKVIKKYTYEKIMFSKDIPEEVLWSFSNLFSYNPETGELKNKKTGKIYDNKPVKGYPSKICIRFENKGYYVTQHRLIWYLLYNVILPKNVNIDHINRIKTDNRKINLRACNNSENGFNKVARGKINFKGVCSYTNKKGDGLIFSSSINIEKSFFVIGKFKTAELAAKFYDAAARYYQDEFSVKNFENVFITPDTVENLRTLKKTNYRYD